MASKYLNTTGLTYFWGRIQALFVAKETGKGLSSNDYTAEEKAQVAKIAGIEAAEENVIETVKVNGTALTPDAQKAVDVQVATLTDTNSSNLHTATIAAARASNGEQYQLSFADTSNGLTAKYQQPNGESRATFFEKAIPDETRVNALIAAAVTEGVGDITSFRYEPVATLPASGENGVIYLVPNGGSNPNVKDEYLWINKGTTESPDYGFELLGTRELDLSGYLQSTDIEAITTAEIDEITGNTATP